MKKQKRKYDARNVVVATAMFIALAFMISCGKKEKQTGDTDHTNHQESPETYYTCPMHPSVVSEQPGVCPVCNMNLVKKEKEDNTTGASHENMLHLTPEQEQMANIQTDTAITKAIAEYITLTGTVTADETKIVTIATRVSGRIEKLHVRNPGEYIEAGQPLYQLYSEQLLADEWDYVNAWRQIQENPSGKEIVRAILEASRKKLLLWGLSEQQIEDLEKQGERSPYITFYSNTGGYVTDLIVREGQYATEGTPLMKIASLNTVWVEAQVYAGESGLLKNQPVVEVTLEQFPQNIFKGRVVYYNPQLEQGTKINLVRIAIDNPGDKLKPGMMAYVQLRQKETRTLVIPKSAVLMEKMKTVWILSEPGMYERRMVETGIENPREIAITEGLKEGDIVVRSGAYLLNSEYILKSGAAVKHNH